MGSKKKATKKVAAKGSEPVHPIDQGFEVSGKELRKYSRDKLDYYRNQGIAIDKTAHEAHWFKAFVLGRIAQLQTEVETLKKELGTKGGTSVKTKTTNTKRKATSRKTASRTSSRQQSLDL